MAVTNESGAQASTTAADLILRAHRILGNKGSGETLTADEKDTGLAGLNSMLDSFSIEKLMIYQVRQETYTWAANTASITVGSGADFDTHRPIRVGEGTFFRDSGNIDYPVTIVRDRAVFDAIDDKTVVSSYPELLFYEPSVSWGTLHSYPISNQSLTLYLNQWQPLQVFDTLTEAMLLPPGYKRMIEYNLAAELEADVGLPLSAGARKIAGDAKKAIKRNNNLPVYSETESFYALNNRTRSDIYAGK